MRQEQDKKGGGKWLPWMRIVGGGTSDATNEEKIRSTAKEKERARATCILVCMLSTQEFLGCS